jgi:D-glycero-D-manno-heptose 1,7-bisphosphate phosphatase
MRRRGLLLDRDGVINIDHGYVGSREQFEFLPGLFPFLQTAQDLGFRLAMLTNQSGVARGLYTAEDFERLTAWMQMEIGRHGIAVDLVLACFEHNEASIPVLRRQSFWRKPNPGMVLEAIQRLDLDPARSAFLGDHARDMEAAKAGGIGTRLLLTRDTGPTTQGITAVTDFEGALTVLRRLAV